MSEVVIGGRTVGAGHPAFLTAELGANHDRDLVQALFLVDLAAEAGVDAVKLQTYTADSLTLRSDHPSTLVDPVWGSKNLYELYEKAAMPVDFHQPLVARANERNLIIFTSVYDPRDVEFCESLDLPAYKIASFELVHLPLLRTVAQTGKPVILSTGMANLGEVEEALETLRGAGCSQVILLHCCSAYPADPPAVNLAAMDTLRAAFGCPVGFSDHTLGTHIAGAAVARGACFIEKHFTSDRNRPGPDHRFSLEPSGLATMVRYMRDIESAIGTGRKQATESEAINKRVGRRSVFAIRQIDEGEVISADALRIVRPGSGLHPRLLETITGRVARRRIPAGYPVTLQDV